MTPKLKRSPTLYCQKNILQWKEKFIKSLTSTLKKSIFLVFLRYLHMLFCNNNSGQNSFLRLVFMIKAWAIRVPIYKYGHSKRALGRNWYFTNYETTSQEWRQKTSVIIDTIKTPRSTLSFWSRRKGVFKNRQVIK